MNNVITTKRLIVRWATERQNIVVNELKFDMQYNQRNAHRLKQKTLKHLQFLKIYDETNLQNQVK